MPETRSPPARADRIRTGDVLRLGEIGRLPARHLGRALQLAGCAPTAAGWRDALDRLLLGMGAAMILAGIICVVAYNWSAIPRWGRFALAEAVLLGVFGTAVLAGTGSRYGQVLLAVAIGLIGPLLALFGQTYQTGADTFELFRGWALLALPWVVASRFAPAWLLWLAVAETALLLYLGAFDLWQEVWFGFAPTWLLATLVNLLALILWEFGARRFDWLAGRLGPRFIAACLVAPLTVLTCASLFPVALPGRGLAPLAWTGLMAAGYVAYRIHRLDLPLLALGWLSCTVVVVAATGRVLIAFDAAALAFVLGAAVLVVSSSFGRQWLKAVAVQARAAGADAPRDEPGDAADGQGAAGR